MPRRTSKTKQRNVKDLIEITWKEIDRCLKKLEDDSIKDKHKILWSQNLASYVSRLDKMLTKAGADKLDEESLAKLLQKIPKKYKNIVLRRVHKHAKKRHGEKG